MTGKKPDSEICKALKIQLEASLLGFDWPSPEPVFAKILEELSELKQAVSEGQQSKVAEEFGDLIFAMINLSRHLNLDINDSLRLTNEKFTRRFLYVQSQAKLNDVLMEPANLQLLEQYWQNAKKQEAEFD